MRLKKINEERNFKDPNTWTYIKKYPSLVKFAEGFSEERLELLNFTIRLIEDAYSALQKAEWKEDYGLKGISGFKDTLRQAAYLTKCWNALKKNGNW